MKIRWCYLALALTGALAASIILGVAAPRAHAQTADQKSTFYRACVSHTSGSVSNYRACCNLAGGHFTVEYNLDGSVSYVQCTFTSDPAEVAQGPGLVNANPTTAIPPTGANTSSTSSGGKSNAGQYGLVTVTDYPVNIIP